MRNRFVTIGILARGCDRLLVDIVSVCVTAMLDIIIVVDADRTPSLLAWAGVLEGLGAQVHVYFKRSGSLAEQRNELHRLSQTPLVAHIDSDEVPDQALLKALQCLIPRAELHVWRVRLVTCIWGKPLRWGGLVHYKVRVLPKEMQWLGKVHEVPEFAEGTSTLDGSLMHFTTQSIDEWMQKTRSYVIEDAKTRTWKYPLVCLLLRPPAKMIRGLLWRRGILDGVEGLVAQWLAFVYEALLCLAVLERRRLGVRLRDG